MSRLERLRKLVQADIDALPDRPVSPKPVAVAVENHDSGDVSIGVLSLSDQPPSTASKQSPSDPPAHIKPAPVAMKPVPVSAVSAAPAVSPQANAESRFVWCKDAVSTYNPNPGAMPKSAAGAPPSSSATSTPALPPNTGLQRGDLAAADSHFTSIHALSKYPYRFCSKSDSQSIATAFFDEGKFWAREWDLYYIWDVEPSNPIILVRESQFQQLLNEINSRLRLKLRITDSQREEGLVIRFPDHPECLPRYLGRSRSKDEIEAMTEQAPEKEFRPPGERHVGPPDSGTLEQFKQLMQDLYDVQKKKNKAKREKNHVERLGRQLSLVDNFKRAQRYLGLRAAESTASGPAQSIDPTSPAPFPFEQAVVFVSVDVESYEKEHHRITEVGVATLDTCDLIGVPPGVDGVAWRDLIKPRHFRIKENMHLINSQWVSGHPDGFEFGASTIVTLEEAPEHVAACFNPPFGVHTTNTPEEVIVNMLGKLDFTEKRKIILLGHDIMGDVRYLQHLGCDHLTPDAVAESLDTAKLYQAWRREQNITSLGRIMGDLDVAAWKLHNAGNDAVYTLYALLGTCMREAQIRGSPELETMRNEDKAARLAAAQETALQRAKDEADGWSDNEAAGDGGVLLKS